MLYFTYGIPESILINKDLIILRKFVGPLSSEDFNLELIDPSILFCDDQKCSMLRDQTILYRDDNHLNLPASRFVGEFIVRNSSILDKN